jgi:hypothetical protein
MKESTSKIITVLLSIVVLVLALVLLFSNKPKEGFYESPTMGPEHNVPHNGDQPGGNHMKNSNNGGCAGAPYLNWEACYNSQIEIFSNNQNGAVVPNNAISYAQDKCCNCQITDSTGIYTSNNLEVPPHCRPV